MFLSELTIGQFRSYQAAKLRLDGRPVAIYGPNGAGKTNLLEAVSLMSPGRGLRRASAESMMRKPQTEGWKLRGLVDLPEQRIEIETWSRNGEARQVRIDGQAESQIVLGQLVRVLWLVPSMDRLWIEGAEGRRRFLDRMTLSFIPDHARISMDYEKLMRERNRLLKEGVRDDHWYAALETPIAEAGLQIHKNRSATLEHLTRAQQNSETAFPAAALSLLPGDLGIPQTVADFQTALAETRPRDLAAGRTLIGPHRSDLLGTYVEKDLPAKDCSTGEQKALLISLILANARALTSDYGSPPLLLLDEIAAHLDSNRRATLYEEICALGAQAWMTGTGAEQFAELGKKAQVFCVSEDSAIRRPN